MARNNRRSPRKWKASEIDIYVQYLKGATTHKVARKAPPAYRELTSVGVIPFGSGLPTAGTGYVATTMTRGALGILSQLSVPASRFGVETSTSATLSNAPAGWYPAIAVITLKRSTATKLTGKSVFTGRDRNYLPGRTGSVPFGRNPAAPEAEAGKKANTAVDNVEYADMVKFISEAVGNATFEGKKIITFKPEVYRKVRATPKQGLDAVAPVF